MMNDTNTQSAHGAQANSGNREDEIDLGNLLATLWRGKLWIAFCSVIALIIGIYYAFVVAVPVYTASSTVALESRQEQVVDIESVVTGLGGDQSTLNTEVEVIRSRSIVEDLVIDLQLTKDPEFNAELRDPPTFTLTNAAKLVREHVLRAGPADRPEPTERATLDAVIDAVSAKLSVTNIRQSFVFRITAVTENASKSALIANRLAELYIQDQIAVKFEKTEQATQWLSGRVSDLQIELETAEAELKEFSSNTDLISPEGLIAMNRQLKDLRDRKADLVGTHEMATERLERLQTAGASGDIALMAGAADDRSIDQSLVEEAAGGSATARARLKTRFDQVLARVQLEKSRSEGQLIALEASIREISRNIDTQSTELVRLQQLQREAEASGLIYEYFLSRLKETSVQQGIQQADSRVLSAAVVPISPSAPRKSIILALSLILGAMLGSALVLLREFSQNTFRVAADLEAKTGYAVIGQVPSIPARRRKNVLKYLKDKPNSAAAEAIRSLRTSILLANLDNPPKVIMSTSSIPGEGKTTQSIAMAQNLSGLGKKVLLIEGDIRRRVFSEYFDIKNKKGLLSVLLGETALEEARAHVPDLAVDILIGERSSTNAADVFSSEKFAKFLDEMRAKYDYVIIDTPPVLAVTDSRVIGQWVDAIIYTVKWDSTTRRQVHEGLKAFEQVNLRVSGLVLGQIDAKGMKRYGYGDSYGAYSSYYDN